MCHNRETGSAVVVLDYYVRPAGAESGDELIGVVWFGPDAESHRGLCHGGAMTSLMDDICGHGAFILAGGGPWSGATVQVNCSLKAPVKVGSVLRVTGRVAKRAGRKLHIHAVLDDGGRSSSGAAGDDEDRGGGGRGGGNTVYAVLEGLSIAGVKLSSADDAVARRVWADCGEQGGGVGGTARQVRQDSGWDEDNGES